MESVSDMLNKVTIQYDRALDQDSYIDFHQLKQLFHQTDDMLREQLQELTLSDIHAVINRLTQKKPLSPEEQNMLRTWIVGDAENYLRYENNYEDWEQELKRLMDEMTQLQDTSRSVYNTLKLRALAKDARRVVDDIVSFKEDKERVERFEQATRELDRDQSDLLISILKDKLLSDKH